MHAATPFAESLCVSGWAVQNPWLHYKYAPDREFLRAIAYPAVRDVALFYADFMDQCQTDAAGRVVARDRPSAPNTAGWASGTARPTWPSSASRSGRPSRAPSRLGAIGPGQPVPGRTGPVAQLPHHAGNFADGDRRRSARCRSITISPCRCCRFSRATRSRGSRRRPKRDFSQVRSSVCSGPDTIRRSS